MRLHRALLTVALAVLPLTAPAHAVTCPLLPDPVGDAYLGGSTGTYVEGHGYWPIGVPNAPASDIVSVDVASGATIVAAEMRLVTLDMGIHARLGFEWIVTWAIGTNRYSAHLRFTGNAVYVAHIAMNGTSLGAVPFTLDTATGTIRWEIPRSLLPDLATPGGTFHHIFGVTNVFSGTADVASDYSVTYVDGTAGCIPAA